ncbi:MAG: helix-turn-helix domain-containing protein [Planctomycetota bacterium]
MAEADLLDAREAMSLLGISENELQNLVARGDLRAFRSAGTMKFRRDDVVAIKSDKGTEPTIIIPAAAQRKGASGILPAVPAPARPPSRIGQAFSASAPIPPTMPAMPSPVAPSPIAAAPGTETSDIVLDDIELMPTDGEHITQQVTVAQPAVSADIGGATVLESASAATGEMTVVDAGPGAETGPATPVTASGRRRALSASGRHMALAGAAAAPPAPGAAAAAPPAGGPAMASPAVSRVARAAPAGVSIATSKRTQAVYQPKSAGPLWTALCVLNSLILMLAASVVGVMMTSPRCDYDPVSQLGSKQRVIPPFLSSSSQFKVYEWCYEATPGNPEDKDRPSSEYPFKGK